MKHSWPWDVYSWSWVMEIHYTITSTSDVSGSPLKKGKKKNKQTKKAREIIFSLSFLGRLILFHLTTAFNSYQSSTSTILPPFCQQSLRTLTESQSLNWQWRRLPATALKQFVKKLTNHGRLAAFKKRTIVFKKCLLPCILKQYLRDCFTQGRRALNQVINSD